MKTNNAKPASRQVSDKLLAGLLLAATFGESAKAGTFYSDFNSGQPPGTILYGDAFIDTTGGIGNSGALKLTQTLNSQQGSLIINNLDGGAAMFGFNATFKMLIGGGNGADGLSFNYAPDLPADSFGEEGAGTGLTVSFDTYNNGYNEAPAIDVKAGGITLATTKLDSGLFRTDSFVDVAISLSAENRLTLTVNGTTVYSSLFVPLMPAAGKFGLGARTGGLYDNQWVDDLSITTVLAAPSRPTVRWMSPSGLDTRGDASIALTIVDGTSTQLKAGSPRLVLNGSAVAVTSSKVGNVTTVSHTPTHLLPPGLNTVLLTFTDTSRANFSFSNTFEVSQYIGPNGHVYELVLAPSHITWPNAKTAAEQRLYAGHRGHLATITSWEEDFYLENLRRVSPPWGRDGQAWVGGYQTPGSAEPGEGWVWINNEGPIPSYNWSGNGYANWLWPQPDNYLPEFGGENYLAIGLGGNFGWNDEGVLADGTLDAYMVEYEPETIQIDIQPGSFPNVVNVSQTTKTPVAILSTGTFNAAGVDTATIRFGRTGTEAGPVGCALKDVNGDKRYDLVCDFDTQETGIACGDTTAQLRAMSKAGWPLRGADSVKPIQCLPFNLSAIGLQDKQHQTDIYLTVTPVVSDCPPPALAQSVQLQSLNLLGRVEWAASAQDVILISDGNGSTTGALQYSNLHRYQNFSAKAQVKSCQGASTVSPRTNGIVLFRPDLAIGNVSAPQSVFQNAVFNIYAIVSELNGDLGATATLYLKEGETVLDSVSGYVWPYGAAGVVFATSLSQMGTHNLSLVIASQNPGDYDSSNNRIDFTVEVSEPVAYHYAYYTHNSREFRNEYNYPWWESGISEGRENNEYFNENIYIPAALAFPLDEVRIVMTADGNVVDDVALPNVAADYSYFDGTYGYDQVWKHLADGTDLYIYSYLNPWSPSAQVNLYRAAADTVYYSIYHNIYYGVDGGSTNEWKYGTFLNATSALDARIVVTSNGKSWGGTANMAVYTYPFDNTWNYEDPETGYFERGYSRGSYSQGYSQGYLQP